MREIEFRGKEEYSEKWRFGFLVKTEKREYDTGDIFPSRTIIQTTDDCYDVHLETVGEYTGLKDKNGVRIFEGDIVNLHQFLFDGDEYENELEGVIVYDEKLCAFCLTKIKNASLKKYMGYKEYEDVGTLPMLNFYGLHEESWEVISTIHDNPELLKEADND
jgi:uncharacterized phage protein (TIGR01671 family)